MISDITTKVRVDCRKNAIGIMDGTTEYVDTEPAKYFHVVFCAKLNPEFNGKLRMEVNHQNSGFFTYDIINNPPKYMLMELNPDDMLCFGSPGIRISRLLGENYRAQLGQCDYVNVKLYLDNREIVNKDFIVRGTFS